MGILVSDETYINLGSSMMRNHVLDARSIVTAGEASDVDIGLEHQAKLRRGRGLID